MSEKIKNVLITTDGSVAGDKSGYGYVVRDNENDRMIGRARGGVKEIVDIDQIEAIAVLQAIKYVAKKMDDGIIAKDAKIHLLSDSKRNEMIFTEGRIEPIEANVSRWREARFITKDWNFTLGWIKSHVSDLDKALMSQEKAKQHSFNDLADIEAKKGRYMEAEKEEVNEKGKVLTIDGYIDPNPILSSIKVENSYPQQVEHTTINNGKRKEESWETHKNGSRKNEKYLSRYISMKKEALANEKKAEQEQNNIIQNDNKEDKSKFKNRFKAARGRFEKQSDNNKKFQTVEELNAQQGYKGKIFK